VLRVYFKDCFIKGDVDFIFGGAAVFFDGCEIFSNNRDMDPNGYITAASTPEGQEWGMVFNRCRLTGDCAADSVYLGRPWRDYAHTAFISCHMGAHRKKVGWMNWNKPEAEQTARYEEYASEGPGGDMSGRVGWSKILTAEEAGRYTIENVLGGWTPGA
jgi:pectinesterase